MAARAEPPPPPLLDLVKELPMEEPPGPKALDGTLPSGRRRPMGLLSNTNQEVELLAKVLCSLSVGPCFINEQTISEL